MAPVVPDHAVAVNCATCRALLLGADSLGHGGRKGRVRKTGFLDGDKARHLGKAHIAPPCVV